MRKRDGPPKRHDRSKRRCASRRGLKICKGKKMKLNRQNFREKLTNTTREVCFNRPLSESETGTNQSRLNMGRVEEASWADRTLPVTAELTPGTET